MSDPFRPTGDPAPVVLRRDRPESTFATILRGFLTVHPAVLAAVFVDRDGECVDYASSLEPFDAQVIGAQLSALTVELAARVPGWGAGALVLWLLEGGTRDFAVRRVSDEYTVVAVLEPHGINARLLRSLAALAEALRREAALPTAAWDPWGESLAVELRRSPGGWGYAPSAIGSGPHRRPVEVLGRWVERGSISAQQIVCFRVRCVEERGSAHEPGVEERGSAHEPRVEGPARALEPAATRDAARRPGRPARSAPHAAAAPVRAREPAGSEELTLVYDRSLDRWQQR